MTTKPILDVWIAEWYKGLLLLTRKTQQEFKGQHESSHKNLVLRNRQAWVPPQGQAQNSA